MSEPPLDPRVTFRPKTAHRRCGWYEAGSICGGKPHRNIGGFTFCKAHVPDVRRHLAASTDTRRAA